MEYIKKCVHCKKLINLNVQKYVLLGTYDSTETLGESFFHFECWKEYFNNCVRNKNKQTAVSYMETPDNTLNIVQIIKKLNSILPKEQKLMLGKLLKNNNIPMALGDIVGKLLNDKRNQEDIKVYHNDQKWKKKNMKKKQV